MQKAALCTNDQKATAGSTQDNLNPHLILESSLLVGVAPGGRLQACS